MTIIAYSVSLTYIDYGMNKLQAMRLTAMSKTKLKIYLLRAKSQVSAVKLCFDLAHVVLPEHPNGFA